jgi:hypothetical protein
MRITVLMDSHESREERIERYCDQQKEEKKKKRLLSSSTFYTGILKADLEACFLIKNSWLASITFCTRILKVGEACF